MKTIPSDPPAERTEVMPYWASPLPQDGWIVGEVMLGLVVGLATILLGLPVFLLWAYRHLPSSDWTLPLVLYAAVVAGLLGGAFAVRRSDRLPGLFPGMCAGVAGGLVVIGAVYLAA